MRSVDEGAAARGRRSRQKGQRGERELFALLSPFFGQKLQRRVNSTRDGGCDQLAIPGWAVEVKRAESYSSAYWAQAVAQARAEQRKPVLFWRKSRMPWQAYVDAYHVNPTVWPEQGGEPVCLTWRAWVDLALQEQACLCDPV